MPRADGKVHPAVTVQPVLLASGAAGDAAGISDLHQHADSFRRTGRPGELFGFIGGDCPKVKIAESDSCPEKSAQSPSFEPFGLQSVFA